MQKSLPPPMDAFYVHEYNGQVHFSNLNFENILLGLAKRKLQ